MAESTELTVESAAPAFEGLLSAEDGTQEPEKKEGAESTEGEAGEESEGETETEAEESDDAEQEESEEEEPSYTVKIDGKDAKVPLKELLSGYQRTADYSKKTMAIAEQRKALESDLSSTKAAREHYAEMLDKVKAMVEQNAPKEPDWDTLLAQNPAEFVKQRYLFEKQQQTLAQVQAEQEQIGKARKAEEEKAKAEFVAEQEKKLLEAIPEWKDQKKALSGKVAVAKYLVETFGLPKDELDAIDDHRLVILADKARRFDEMQAKLGTLKPNVQQPAVRTVRGGNASQTPANDMTRAMKRLEKTGDVDDAAAVFMHFVS